MRVISGKYRGRNIHSPFGQGVRPTTDKVKESLFSVLESRGVLEGADFLDLFCGTGAIGIEALSRGASSCVFVDADTSNAAYNLDKIGISARLVCADFRRALRLLRNEKFDIVFCDPPYRTGFASDALELILRYDIIKQNGLIILEHSSENDLINVPENCIIDRRSFGAATFEIIMRGKDEGDFGRSV